MFTPLFLVFDASPSVRNFFNATTEVNDWYTLGLQLGIKTHTLRDIQQNYGLSQDNRRQEMFDVWLRSDPSASWEKLIDALDTMEYCCLARSVKTKYADVYSAQKEQGMFQKYICIPIVQSCTGKYHKFVAVCIVTSDNANGNKRVIFFPV